MQTADILLSCLKIFFRPVINILSHRIKVTEKIYQTKYLRKFNCAAIFANKDDLRIQHDPGFVSCFVSRCKLEFTPVHSNQVTCTKKIEQKMNIFLLLKSEKDRLFNASENSSLQDIQQYPPVRAFVGIQYNLGCDPSSSTVFMTFCPSRSTISTALNTVCVSVAVVNNAV